MRWIRSQLSHALSLSGHSKQHQQMILIIISGVVISFGRPGLDIVFRAQMILIIISGVVISFGRPGLDIAFRAHTTTTKFGKPLLNHSIGRSKV